MALLPNNRVVKLWYPDIIAWADWWYNAFIDNLYHPYYRPTTSDEDIQYLLRQFNCGNTDYEAYIDSTQYDDGIPEELRSNQIEALEEYLSNTLSRWLPEFPGFPCMDVHISYENNMLYILDTRRMVYVPNELLTVVRFRNDNASDSSFSQTESVDLY